jgi:hypothetical protein
VRIGHASKKENMRDLMRGPPAHVMINFAL